MAKAIARRMLGRGREWLDRWRDFRDCRRALHQGSNIFEDAYGIRFVLYPWDRPYLATLVRRTYDRADFQAIASLIHPGDVAFDVGAHVGEYTVLLSRLCGSAGCVWAFEPVPETYWRLRETLALNRCGNVIPIQKAINDKVGAVSMNLFEPQFSGWNTLGMPSMITPEGKRVSPGTSIEVACETLDHFSAAQHVNRINFLKVDVEGFERAVFQGSERLLRERRVDFICFEISQEPLKGASMTSREVFEILASFGYLAYRFDAPTGAFQGPIQDTSEYWVNFYASWQSLSQIHNTAQLDSVRRAGELAGAARR